MSDQQTTVVGVFAKRAQAEGAIDELWHAGYTKDQVGMAFPGEAPHRATTATEALEEKAANGTVAGAVTGGALGAIAGAAVVAAIPGIGPILAMGLLLGLTTVVLMRYLDMIASPDNTPVTPGWPEYRRATFFFVRNQFLEGKTEKEVVEVLDRMASREREWMRYGGERYLKTAAGSRAR